jgi:hypothetical protein
VQGRGGEVDHAREQVQPVDAVDPACRVEDEYPAEPVLLVGGRGDERGAERVRRRQCRCDGPDAALAHGGDGDPLATLSQDECGRRLRQIVFRFCRRQ